MRGQIIKGIGGFYYIETEEGRIRAKGKGLFRKTGEKLVVGDFVEVEKRNDGDSVITEVCPRKNSFIRPPVSNIDKMIIVAAEKEPEISFIIVDRFLITAEKNNIEPIICINKCDIASDAFREKIKRIYGNVYPVVFVSGKTGEGIELLRDEIKGSAAAFAGPSGVGKSTIINRLHPAAEMETGSVSEKTERGRHTTRHVEIFISGESRIFDTPGFTSFDLPSMDEREAGEYYPEIQEASFECRFNNCIHINEPGCAVKEKVASGDIQPERYESYKYNIEEIKKLKNRRKRV